MTTKENMAIYNKVRNTATKRLREKYETEYLEMFADEAQKQGLIYTPRTSKTEKNTQ